MNRPGIYIHFPFCQSKCHYCAFYSKTNDHAYNIYFDSLVADLTELEILLANNPPDTLYFGGGTPSLWPLSDLEKILTILQNKWKFAEITVEANPGTLTEEKIRLYRQWGINRISMGVQSFDDKILQYLGRKHDSRKARNALQLISQNFDNYSVDQIIAVPGYENRLESDLGQITEKQSPHISAYSLSIEENTLFHHQKLATDEEQFCREYFQMNDYLTQQGYRHYEVSNFCRPGYQSIHNSKYWTRTPYLGLGPSAHSFWNEKRFYYSDIKDFTDHRLREKYNQAEKLTKEEQREEQIMLSARTDQGIEQKLLDPEKLDRMLQGGFISLENNKAIATIKGWTLINSMIVELL